MRYSKHHWRDDIIPIWSLLHQPGVSKWGKRFTSVAAYYVHNIVHPSCCLCVRTPEENSSWLTQFTLVHTKRWLGMCTGWILSQTQTCSPGEHLLCSSRQGAFSLLHQAGASVKQNPQNTCSTSLCTNSFTLQIHSYCNFLFINVDIAYGDKK